MYAGPPAIRTNIRSTYLGLLSLLEESLLRLLLVFLVLGEVVRRRNLLESRLVNTADIDALAGGDHIAGVHAAEGNTVDLEGTSNEEDTLVEVLEEDDTLATEAAGKENQDGAGLEGLAVLGGTNRLADLFADNNPCQIVVPSCYCIVVCISQFNASILINDAISISTRIFFFHQYRP